MQLIEGQMFLFFLNKKKTLDKINVNLLNVKLNLTCKKK